MAEVEQPVIIKKIYRMEGGHHGGAWKVAYADFVTAMMAFFLLLWLLSTATDETLEGLAEYFTPTIGLKDQMGIGFEGGEAPVEDGTKKSDRTPPGIVVGMTPQGPIPQDPQKKALIESTEDANLFEKAQEDIKQAFESDPNLAEFKDNIVLEQTPEGLKIKLVDSDKENMFQPGSVELTPFGQRILLKMVPVIEQMPNRISIVGHTDAVPSSSATQTNWELSAERANSARRFFVRNGVLTERVAKIVGLADKELLLPDDPKNPKNRRIEVILLRGSHLNTSIMDMPAPRSLLSVPDAEKISREEGGSSGGAYTTDPKKFHSRNIRIPGRPADDTLQNPVDAVKDNNTGQRNLVIPPVNQPTNLAPASEKPATAR